MPPDSSRLDGEESRTPIMVLLMGGVEAESFGGNSPVEIHRCADVRQVSRFWEAGHASVLFVDLERLSEGERAHLRKQMTPFNAVLVVAIADSIDDKACEKLLRMGCVGSLPRREAPATFLRAVKAVIAGELWFPRATLSRVLRTFLAAQDPDRLTSRELEIMALVGADLNNQQIADKLFISRETVRWHIKSLHGKLGIRARRGLRDHVRLLHRLGKTIPAQRASSDNLPSLSAG
jgi:DNA-binding NarL/FixJ family response regulator